MQRVNAIFTINREKVNHFGKLIVNIMCYYGLTTCSE